MPEPKRGRGFWVFLSFFLLVILTALIALIVFWTPISKAIFGGLASPVSATNTALETLATESTSVPVLQNTATPTIRPTHTPLPTHTSEPTITSSPTDTPIPTATLQGGGYSQIAFASNRTGMPQIFLMNADGSNQQQLTNLPEGACQPDWSPDGTRIVFISPCFERKDIYYRTGLFIMNAAGSEITPLPASEEGDFDPAWAPDGNRIAFTSLRDGKPQIYILDLTNNSVTGFPMANDIQEALQPAWSPSGTQIVYSVRRVGVRQVWVMSDTGVGQEQLIRSGSEYFDFLPAWSADGQSIVFTQSRGPLSIGWLMSIPYSQRETQDAARVAFGAYAIDMKFSPDGQWMTFETLDEENYEVALMAADGTGRVKLSNDPSADFDPSWRPITP
jgi:Tol biopolymer transport system component